MNIIGNFEKYQDAFNALAKIRTQGFKDSHIPADHFSLGQNGEINVPGTRNSVSLSNLVLNSGDDTAAPPSPLAAADPMVSGMGGFDEITENGYKVIVSASDEDKDTIYNLITSSGGTVIEDSLMQNLPADQDPISSLSYDPR